MPGETVVDGEVVPLGPKVEPVEVPIVFVEPVAVVPETPRDEFMPPVTPVVPLVVGWVEGMGEGALIAVFVLELVGDIGVTAPAVPDVPAAAPPAPAPMPAPAPAPPPAPA